MMSKIDAAADEAVSMFESDVDDGEDFSEEQSDDIEHESDADRVGADEEEEEQDGDIEEDDEEEAALSVIDWNGNPDELPTDIVIDGKRYDLTKTYKAMQAGFTKKMQEVAAERKKYEELSQHAMQIVESKKQAQAIADDPRPTNPTSDMSDEQQERRWEDIQRWVARDEQRRLVREGIIPDPNMVRQQMLQQEQQYAAQRRFNMLTSQPGWNEQTENAMIAIAQADEFWAEQLHTDHGAMKLYEFVQEKIAADQFRAKAAELENAKVKRSASASKRATPAPSSQNKSASKKPADVFAEMGFEDKLDAAIREGFGL
jgi:hypothetical protein